MHRALRHTSLAWILPQHNQPTLSAPRPHQLSYMLGTKHCRTDGSRRRVFSVLWLCTRKHKILKQDSWFKNITNLLPILREKKKAGERESRSRQAHLFKAWQCQHQPKHFTPWAFLSSVMWMYVHPCAWLITSFPSPTSRLTCKRAAWKGFTKSGSGVAATMPANGSSCCSQQCLHLTAPSSLSPNSLSHLQGTKSLKSPISLNWTTICSTTLSLQVKQNNKLTSNREIGREGKNRTTEKRYEN